MLTGQAAYLADTRWQTSASKESDISIVPFPTHLRHLSFRIGCAERKCAKIMVKYQP